MEVVVARSKCLPQGYEDLCSFDFRQRIQVVPAVHSYRSHWGSIAQPDSDRVGVIRAKVAEANMLKNISAVIEGNNAESLLDRNGNAKLRVENEKFAATCGHSNQRTAGSVGRMPAHRNCALWPRAV